MTGSRLAPVATAFVAGGLFIVLFAGVVIGIGCALATGELRRTLENWK